MKHLLFLVLLLSLLGCSTDQSRSQFEYQGHPEIDCPAQVNLVLGYYLHPDSNHDLVAIMAEIQQIYADEGLYLVYEMMELESASGVSSSYAQQMDEVAKIKESLDLPDCKKFIYLTDFDHLGPSGLAYPICGAGEIFLGMETHTDKRRIINVLMHELGHTHTLPHAPEYANTVMSTMRTERDSIYLDDEWRDIKACIAENT